MTLSFLSLLLLLPGQLHADHLVLRELTDYPLALCNDGTHATYHYTQGDIHNPYMLIYLQGGGACATEESCNERCKDGNALCTSDTAPSKDKDNTMWSTDPEENPPFHDFGKVLFTTAVVMFGLRDVNPQAPVYPTTLYTHHHAPVNTCPLWVWSRAVSTDLVTRNIKNLLCIP